ncbi:Type I restriction-modification system, DNA methylase subunit [Actinomyces ruminicola]|uniref:site-specific DNA-methyltransferase (adenine-specific) n=1 Tax=Actinomyces ruminicola TaxID=332524 RepID=A0A1H0DF73_9ACTO|nr:N-6 DNA methylase [Actinomyces ruminicola]SDN68629.1 Type I restriction-modification system, DNA methylase subunit [Actinomyces ruminicola]
MAESITENLFRTFHGAQTFIEKHDIPKEYGFLTKKDGGTDAGYPDFFKDMDEWIIVVEAKSGAPGPKTSHAAAEAEVQGYMANNAVPDVDIVGIAVSGQTMDSLKVTYYFRKGGTDDVEVIDGLTALMPLDALAKHYQAVAHGDPLSDIELRRFLLQLNERFHKDSRVRDTERSLFFSALMIALDDNPFRAVYQSIDAPEDNRLVEARYLNDQIVEAVQRQLSKKVNSRSKEIDWADRFAFVKTVDIPLDEYKNIIADIDERVHQPSKQATKRDVLGRAYKIFLSRAGKMDNKNIILTPDHIIRLMVDLADLGRDDVVLDTCMGSGGFLMEAMEQLVDMAHGDQERIDHIHNHQLIGIELDPILFALACSNMFLHGDGRSNLLYRDSLINRDRTFAVTKQDEKLRDYIRSLKPNKCVINPPYEGDHPINFTISALNYLEEGGRLVIIMPNNTLSKSSNARASESILRHAQLDFVIDMPQQLFFEQGRGVKTSIFGFTKSSNGHRQDSLVTFVDMEDDGHEVRYGAGRRDSGRWTAIATAVERAVRDHLELEAARSWRSVIYDDQGRLEARGVRRNPWPQAQSHDLDAAVADWQEARVLRKEAYERMNEALLAVGLGVLDA